MRRTGGETRGGFREYDLHAAGMRVDDALAALECIVSSARRGGSGLFAVVTGYGSSGGTSLIKEAVLAACREYRRLNHIRGFLDGEKAADLLSPESLAFPDSGRLPPLAQSRGSIHPGLKPNPPRSAAVCVSYCCWWCSRSFSAWLEIGVLWQIIGLLKRCSERISQLLKKVYWGVDGVTMIML